VVDDDEELAFADRREQVASRRRRKQNHKSFAVKDGDVFYEPSDDEQQLSSGNLIKPMPTE